MCWFELFKVCPSTITWLLNRTRLRTVMYLKSSGLSFFCELTFFKILQMNLIPEHKISCGQVKRPLGICPTNFHPHAEHDEACLSGDPCIVSYVGGRQWRFHYRYVQKPLLEFVVVYSLSVHIIKLTREVLIVPSIGHHRLHRRTKVSWHDVHY